MGVATINVMMLVAQYKQLWRKIVSGAAEESYRSEVGPSLDALYARIVALPVVDFPMAVQKLWFAHHCLTEEYDIKEAANIIRQVCLGLEKLLQGSGEDIFR